MKGSSCEIDKAPLWIQSGTYPRPSALPELFMHFERDPGCGAATGELTVERPFRNFLTAVQFCEWKTAHLLNKPIESLCGYLTVLPGAFSAFRWKAVEGDPLRAYFMGLYAQADLNAFESNMFLAEDRILCLEIVAKENCAYRQVALPPGQSCTCFRAAQMASAIILRIQLSCSNFANPHANRRSKLHMYFENDSLCKW